MPEEQWIKYAREELDGNRVVDWTGWIVSVDADVNASGKYIVIVDVDPPSGTSRRYVHLKDVRKQIALQLQKGQKIVFSGEIYLISLQQTQDIYLTNVVVSTK